jgi:hypothetical protein
MFRSCQCHRRFRPVKTEAPLSSSATIAQIGDHGRFIEVVEAK